MRAPDSIRSVWQQFIGIPLESFTKGWWFLRSNGAPRQRTTAEMEEHRQQLGAGGNCFDLAIWLRHRLLEARVSSRIIGHDLESPDAHVAVLAKGADGFKYLCDLGDQWLEPILISSESPAFSHDWQVGFFPGRSVRIERTAERVIVHYRLPNGKESRQAYDLEPLSEQGLERVCNHSQRLLRRPFCEVLLPDPDTGELLRWEYDRGESFWNLTGGDRVFEPAPDSFEGWVTRITSRTGLSPELVRSGFAAYTGREGEIR